MKPKLTQWFAVLACGAGVCLASHLQAATAVALYDYEDGDLGDAVTTITDAVGTDNMNVKTAGTTVTLTNSATELLGLAGYYNGSTQTVMTYTNGANIGSLASFAVSGWIDATTTTSNVFIAGNRYGTSAGSAGWEVDITRCNISGGTNNNLNFNYSNTSTTVLSYKLGAENVAGNSLGWTFFTWMGVDNGGGTITLNLFIGDTEGNLSLVGSVIQSTGSGDSNNSNSGMGSSSVKSTTAQYQGALDEMTLWDGSLDYTLAEDGTTVVGGELYDLYMSAIPEPAASAGVFALAVFALALRRRR